jgi:hypothetical protein
MEETTVSWSDGHQVDGQDARQRNDESRFIFGGQGGPGKPGHGEVISHDGVNANYVRDPGGYVPVDDRQADPYAGYQSTHDRHVGDPLYQDRG